MALFFGDTDLRNAQNYSRLVTALFAAASFVAAIGSVSARNNAQKPPTNSTQRPTSANLPGKSPGTVVNTPTGAVDKAPGGTLSKSGAVRATAKKAPAAAIPAASPVPKTKTSRRAQRLVPPPPPSIPLATLSTGGGSSFNMQYMSKEELTKLHTKLKEQLAKAKTRFDDHEKRVQQQREKIVLYEKLLQEGVVSRRDLENARNELDDLEARTGSLEDQVLQLTNELTAVKKLAPAQKPQ